MTTLYVVMGQTGEYSDRQEWPVRAFVDGLAAQTFVNTAEAWLREHFIHADSEGRLSWREAGEQIKACPFDPSLQVDYAGARYYIMEVPLDDAVRQDIANTVLDDVAAGKLPRRVMRLVGDV